MELLTCVRRIPETEEFPQHIDPFPQTTGYDLVYDQLQPTAVIHTPEDEDNVDDDAAIIIATNQAPPQKLRPIRCSGRSPTEDPPVSAAGWLDGALDKLPELDFLGDQVCAVGGETGGLFFEGPVRTGVADVADNGCGAHGFVGDDPGHVGSGTGEQGRAPRSVGGDYLGHLTSSSSDSDENSSEDVEEPASRKRKRRKRKKLELFLEHLVAKLMEKQEQMHKQLIEMIEKREREQIIREEAWKQQEIERMKRDEEVRGQEMSRSLGLISFIQNMLGHEIEIPQPTTTVSCMEENGGKSAGELLMQKDLKSDPYNRRWPEAEVQALIMLRTALDNKFRVMASKCSIWDEISVGMYNMGYNRTAKKCKEKWENINKYFRKTVGSGKKHPENSKTCPYFQELDILYKNGLMNPGNPLIYGSNETEAKCERQ